MLRLARRKNRMRGSLLRRGCTCPTNEWMCPVHELGAWLRQQGPGALPFRHLRADVAPSALRSRLEVLDVADAGSYSLHDFRRGHAQDLAVAGGDLRAILEAGEWSSPAFLKYLNVSELERQVVVQAHVDDSDEEEV